MPGTKSNRTREKAALASLPGWDRLRHGGLLLDGMRLATLARHAPTPLDAWTERQLRQRAGAMLNGDGEASSFVAFVLEQVCGLDTSTGAWTRGSRVASDWGRRAVTGETVKPRHLWHGRDGGRLPVFIDDAGRLGIGRSRRAVSRVVGWLRAGGDHLALVTNGRQWRLLFAGLDYDAWCEWDLDLWFEEGELSPQVTALRTLLRGELWTPETEGAEPPLLQAVRDTRKGQAELSEVLGERVREAVEILIRAHGNALSSLVELEGVQDYVEDLAGDAGVSAPALDEIQEMFGAGHADIYRAACRVAMRLVVILFAESRDLLPRDNPLYHQSYGLHGLRERLERAAARGGSLAGSFGAWPRVLALFALVREGSHHPDLPVTAYGGDLFAPGAPDAADGVSRSLHVYEQACFRHELMPDHDVHEMLRLLTRTTIRIRQGRLSIAAVVPVDFSDLSSEYIGILYEGLLDYELKIAPAGDPVVFLSVGDQPALPLSRLEAMDDGALRTLFERLKEKSGGTDDLPEEKAAGDDASNIDENTEEEESLLSDAADATPSPDGPPEHAAGAADERQRNRTRAEEWARRAVQAARLLKKSRGRDTPERRLAFEHRLAAKARQLVARVVLPGEWHLVRWGGTRKGSGSFYTRPGLAVPTVQRTLRPLAYDPPSGADGQPDIDAPAARWSPKPPERILDLTVCDPACGSGTFPLAALRFLTDALYAALQHHDRLQPDGERVLVRLLGIRGANENDGDDSRLADELIPCRPDDDSFEPRLKAVLRRHVVERCIYAVDLDPLAVELCRLSLWLETMDRDLPFGFLDHKVKCGNALIGAWFDQFRHYPVMAWKNREGGDKNHSNGVHFEQNARTKAIKRFVRERLTPDLQRFLGGATLFQADLLEQAAAAHDDALAVLERMHAMPVHDAAERARVYRDELVGSAAWRALKEAMDLWCACWFWPADQIEHAPLPSTFAEPPAETRMVARRVAAEMRFFHWELEFPDVFRAAGSGFDAILGNPPWENLQPNPEEFFSHSDPLFRTYGRPEKTKRQQQIFRRERNLEDGYLAYLAGFKSQSNWVAIRTAPFGGSEAPGPSRSAFSLGKGGKELHRRWASVRRRSPSYSDPNHPFQLQMGRIFTYQLFLEQSLVLLKNKGRCGLIVPSGIYSDAWSRPLRTALLERCRWEWLFGIDNRDKVFPIDSRFKFNPVIVEKGGSTAAIRTAFMRRNVDDWARAEDLATSYTLAQVRQFSPKSHAVLEIQSPRDMEILEKIYANAVLLGDDGPEGWGIKYNLEFMMNTDAHLFPPRPQWETQGYRPDEYSRWLRGDWRPIEELWEDMGVDPSPPVPAEIELEEWLFDTTTGPERRDAEARFLHGHRLKPGDVARTEWRSRCAQPPYDVLLVPRASLPPGVVLSRDGDAWIAEEEIGHIALPLYQGIMIQSFLPSARGWLSGTGLRAKWDYSDLGNLHWNPQYLMAAEDARGRQDPGPSKIGFRDISRDSDVRCFMGALLPGFPCGNSTPTLTRFAETIDGCTFQALASTLVNSYVFDWQIRQRGGGAHLNWHMLANIALPAPEMSPAAFALAAIAVRLNLRHPVYAPELLMTANDGGLVAALCDGERRRLRSILDAIAVAWYDCDGDDLRHVLRDVDLGTDSLRSRSSDLDVRGFWRVDRDKPPELRHTVLTLVAFHDLQAKIDAVDGDREKGIEAFLSQNDGEGWMLPETLRLADYGLGHDERSRQPQPVARRLGPRFYDWQLVQSADESWRECHLHARNLLGEHDYALRIVDLLERRMAAGEDYLGLLTDRFKRDLLGNGGYVTALVEIRARELLYEGSYWATVTDLRNGGHLDDGSYNQLLDRLHARNLLDDVGRHRRRGLGMPTPAAGLPAQRVAEPRAGRQADLFPKKKQRDLFE